AEASAVGSDDRRADLQPVIADGLIRIDRFLLTFTAPHPASKIDAGIVMDGPKWRKSAGSSRAFAVNRSGVRHQNG
ncbi:MAG TPA: hypothetical protein PLV41_11735, partial [Miltoncostaeales bacterium]|nr:hypothetical protein [Miltoncostaeales bacterium]